MDTLVNLYSEVFANGAYHIRVENSREPHLNTYLIPHVYRKEKKHSIALLGVLLCYKIIYCLIFSILVLKCV